MSYQYLSYPRNISQLCVFYIIFGKAGRVFLPVVLVLNLPSQVIVAGKNYVYLGCFILKMYCVYMMG